MQVIVHRLPLEQRGTATPGQIRTGSAGLVTGVQVAGITAPASSPATGPVAGPVAGPASQRSDLRLVLVTCAGPFVPARGGYQNLAVVTARPISDVIDARR